MRAAFDNSSMVNVQRAVYVALAANVLYRVYMLATAPMAPRAGSTDQGQGWDDGVAEDAPWEGFS